MRARRFGVLLVAVVLAAAPAPAARAAVPPLPLPPSEVTFTPANGGQSAPTGQPFARPLAVTVTGPDGAPVPNFPVFWLLRDGGGIFCGIAAGSLAPGTPFFGDQAFILTDTAGVSAITVNALPREGATHVAAGALTQADADAGTSPAAVVFDLTIVPASPPVEPGTPPKDCLGWVAPPTTVPTTVARTTAAPAPTTAAPAAGTTSAATPTTAAVLDAGAAATVSPGAPTRLPYTGTGVAGLAAVAAAAVAIGLLALRARRPSGVS